MENLLDILLDPDNDENITLYNEEGDPTEFEQIATIPYTVEGEERLYAVLKPVIPFEGSDDMSVGIFRVEETEEGDDVSVTAELDDEIAEAVFAEFERLVEEAMGEEDEE